MQVVDGDAPPEDYTSLSTDDIRVALQPVTVTPDSNNAAFINWGKTYRCFPRATFQPEDESHCRLIIELARREGATVRACGAGHSPSDLTCTTGYLLRTDKLQRVLQINVHEKYVVVQAGISLHVLHQRLAQYGLAMSNVGSISDQSLGGVVTTATHGSGIGYAVIPTHVLSLTLLVADGSRVRCSRYERPDLFLATLSGLGTTGFVLTVQLSVEPAFKLREVRQMVTVDTGLDCIKTLAESAEHVRIWWYPQQRVWRVMASDRTNEAPNTSPSWFWDKFIGFYILQFLLFAGRFCSYLTTLGSSLACWLASSTSVAIDVSYKIFNLDCRFPQYTIEWAIPYEETESCLRALVKWLDKELADSRGVRPHFPIEIRFTKDDDIWLSPSHGQKTTWIGLVQYKPYNFPVPYRRYFQGFTDIVAQHKGRPHWAKEHTFRSEGLRRLYPRFDDFLQLIREVDPHGIFRNEYVRRHFFDEEVSARIFKERP
ncbi:L-gulonolactone D-arabinono-1,4-lactone oxidase [Gautieria morchelliformis]|nr:L-gulonolactone D-arabinono-1,4-lactone oxidase [Gautieria morchelliformis]